MLERSIGRTAACLAALSLAALLAGCAPSVHQSWNGPGWYLQKSFLVAYAGPVYLAGPLSYDKCEEERTKLPPETGTQLLCIRENRKPDRFGRS